MLRALPVLFLIVILFLMPLVEGGDGYIYRKKYQHPSGLTTIDLVVQHCRLFGILGIL